MKPDPEVRHRKLGKEQAHGLAWLEENLIELDSRITGIEHLETLVHEMTHILNPKWSEKMVDAHAKKMASVLWKQCYRKVNLV